MSKPEIVICSPVRTAIGSYNGSLKTTPATEFRSVDISALNCTKVTKAAAVGSTPTFAPHDPLP